MSKQLKKQKKIFNELIHWLLKNGAKFPDVSVKHYSAIFRGIVANKFVKRGKIIVSIPFKCIMNVEKAKKSEVGLEIEENKFEPESEHLGCTIFIK